MIKPFSAFSNPSKRWPQDFLFPNRYFCAQVQGLPPVPTYFYHQVEADEFALTCEQIVSCGFRTLTIGDLLDGAARCDHEVLVTFDDGWSSVWSIAFPLAWRHGIRFTLFLVPQAVEESEECRTTLEDVADPAQLNARDLGPRRMLTWGEVRAMHESGLVEIQSHSSHHGVVFTSNEIVGFCTPDGPFPLPGKAPLISRFNGRDIAEVDPALGTPLYQWAPALAGPRRFIEDSRSREQCTTFVRDGGGAEFFRTEGWKDALHHAANKWRGGVWENEDERLERYHNDLLQAKRSIEERLPGARVRAISPPWAVMHVDLPAIARDTGHEVIVLGYPFQSSGKKNPLPLYPRLYGDAIWTLLQGPIRGGVNWLRARRHAIARKADGFNP